MTDEYCTSCGRCKNCGAKEGAGSTLIFRSTPGAANAAAGAVFPLTVETWGAAAGAATAACSHFEVR